MFRFTKTISLGHILLIWFVAVLIVHPIGDFPLNDDWAYALSVKNWMETGRFGIVDWPAMSLFAQVAWGTMFCEVFGFSFNVLRISTMVLALCGVFAFYAILKELEVPADMRKIATAALMFNPFFFELSLTFMTDVPFLSSCLISAFFYLKFFKLSQWRWWIFATLFAVFAILIRQLGLLIPLAFFGAALFSKGFQNLKYLGLNFFSIIIVYGSLKGYLFWLDATTGIPATFANFEAFSDQLSLSFVLFSLKNFTGFYLVYLGLFLAPVLLMRFWSRSWDFYVPFAVLLIVFGYFIEQCWCRFPLENLTYNMGLGPVTLTDFHKGISSFPRLPNFMITGLKLVGLVLAICLAGHLTKSFKYLKDGLVSKTPPNEVFKTGLMLFCLAYVFFLIIDYYHFDRYILLLVPFLLILFSSRSIPQEQFKYTKIGLWTVIGIMAVFSITATHDYFSWNKARWAGLEYLAAQNISPHDIDGGFEFNGWNQTHARNPFNKNAKSWWFVDQDDYVIAKTPYDNYSSIKKMPFFMFNGWRVDTLNVLSRPPWVRVDTILFTMNRSLDSLGLEMQEDYTFENNSKIVELQQENETDFVAIFSETNNYALTSQMLAVNPYEQFSISIEVQGPATGLNIVFSAPESKRFYHTQESFVTKNLEGAWKTIRAEITLPEDYSSDSLQIYLWKPGSEELLVDDYKVIWKRYE